MSKDWRVQVDPRRCSGTGLCAGVAPAHFVLAGGLATVVDELVDEDEDVLDAADCCPMEAITVTGVTDGRIIAPAP